MNIIWRKRDLEFFDVDGCLGANAYLAVTTDGPFKPCSFWPKSRGDLDALDRKMWIDSPDLIAFRKDRVSTDCASCDYLNLCNRGCRVCAGQACGPCDSEEAVRTADPTGYRLDPSLRSG